MIYDFYRSGDIVGLADMYREIDEMNLLGFSDINMFWDRDRNWK